MGAEIGAEHLRARDPVWLSRFGINERKVRDYRHGRIFLAGDAAHVHSPAGGQGMNTGMQDALNLAWKLAMVERRTAAPGLLDSYSIERSAIGDQVLRSTGRMTRIAMLQNPLLRELRDRLAGTLSRLPAIQQRLVDQLTELDLHYPHSPLNAKPHGAASHPAAGARAPDVALGDTRLHSMLGRGRFVLLSVGVATPQVPTDVERLICTATVPGAEGYDGGHHFLVRPDGYLALSASGEDASAIFEVLQRLSSPAAP